MAIVSLVTARGYKFSLKLNAHVYGTINLPTTTLERVNLGKVARKDWRGRSVGFLPAGWQIDVEFTEIREGTLLVIDEAYFKYAANDTLQYRPERFRPMSACPAPVGYSLMESLRQLITVTGFEAWPLLTEHIALSIAARVMMLFDDNQPLHAGPSHTGLPRDRMRRVIDFVETNIHRTIHLSELADVAALSQFHFSRAFRQAIGITPVRYVWQRRVKLAKVLLRNREAPLITVAFDCGFSSHSHFTTVFKRETGLTPMQYRAQLA